MRISTSVMSAGLGFFSFFLGSAVFESLFTVTANQQRQKNTYTFVEENGSSLISQRLCVCVCSCTAVSGER